MKGQLWLFFWGLVLLFGAYVDASLFLGKAGGSILRLGDPSTRMEKPDQSLMLFRRQLAEEDIKYFVRTSVSFSIHSDNDLLCFHRMIGNIDRQTSSNCIQHAIVHKLQNSDRYLASLWTIRDPFPDAGGLLTAGNKYSELVERQSACFEEYRTRINSMKTPKWEVGFMEWCTKRNIALAPELLLGLTGDESSSLIVDYLGALQIPMHTAWIRSTQYGMKSGSIEKFVVKGHSITLTQRRSSVEIYFAAPFKSEMLKIKERIGVFLKIIRLCNSSKSHLMDAKKAHWSRKIRLSAAGDGDQRPESDSWDEIVSIDFDQVIWHTGNGAPIDGQDLIYVPISQSQELMTFVQAMNPIILNLWIGSLTDCLGIAKCQRHHQASPSFLIFAVISKRAANQASMSKLEKLLNQLAILAGANYPSVLPGVYPQVTIRRTTQDPKVGQLVAHLHSLTLKTTKGPSHRDNFGRLMHKRLSDLHKTLHPCLNMTKDNLAFCITTEEAIRIGEAFRLLRNQANRSRELNHSILTSQRKPLHPEVLKKFDLSDEEYATAMDFYYNIRTYYAHPPNRASPSYKPPPPIPEDAKIIYQKLVDKGIFLT